MKKLTNFLIAAFGAGIILTVLGTAFWYYSYRYNDCLAVGHAETYCLMDIFTN